LHHSVDFAAAKDPFLSHVTMIILDNRNPDIGLQRFSGDLI